MVRNRVRQYNYILIYLKFKTKKILAYHRHKFDLFIASFVPIFRNALVKVKNT